ncbi:MAG: hypothetical protein OXC26_04670 [Albidovulum sp.]|nr:hypothetical protein [Albidovulum sp.]
MRGRETPELDAKCFFTDIEIAVLADFATERRLPPGRTISAAPWAWSPRWAATCTASTSGFRGTRSSWLCHARLADSSASTERAMRLGSESEVYKLLRYH